MKHFLRIPSIAALMLIGTLLAPSLVLAQANYGATVTTHTSATVNTSGTAVSGSATVSATTSAKLSKTKSKGDQEIDRRITALTDLNTRVQEMQKVSAAYKQSLSVTIQQLITGFTTLKAKIDADTDAATLKTDILTVTQSYRVFALVIPQARIVATTDRLMTIIGMVNTLGTKLQARVQAAQAGGRDVSALTKVLTDMNAKLTDAQTQTQAAFQHTSGLVPDNGDATKMKSNTAALALARSDIQIAQKDLVAARKDVDTILTGLKGLKAKASASGAASSTNGH
jgi:hypothetical protein